MNVLTQVISIAAAVAILIAIGVWMILRQRDKKTQKDLLTKIAHPATRSARLRTRRNEKTADERRSPDILPDWKEIRSEELPEKDEAASPTEADESSNPAHNVIAITPPGKNGRPKH